jgi:predicted nucleic acid-binding protein
MSAEPLTFVDTNVLVYAHDDAAGPKQTAARAALDHLWETTSGTLSIQVLQEFYVSITRKVPRPVPPAQARQLVGDYTAWPVQLLEPADVLAASELEEAQSLSFWDALIVVASRRSGAERLITEDLKAGQTISGVRIENPFE